MWRARGSAPTLAAVGVTAAALAVGSGVARRYFATSGRRTSAAVATVTRRRPASVGDQLENVETPCLVVDLDAVRKLYHVL